MRTHPDTQVIASHPTLSPQGLVSIAVRALRRVETTRRGGSFLTEGWRPVLELHAFAKGGPLTFWYDYHIITTIINIRLGVVPLGSAAVRAAEKRVGRHACLCLCSCLCLRPRLCLCILLLWCLSLSLRVSLYHILLYPTERTDSRAAAEKESGGDDLLTLIVIKYFPYYICCILFIYYDMNSNIWLVNYIISLIINIS